MKSITAHPESIRRIFTRKYIIPIFQRPYSWEQEQCEKLWTDIIEFLDNKDDKDDKYFLGNIVVHPSSDGELDTLEVIDGQQRLTTLLLLIKAIHSRCNGLLDAGALEACLKTKDPITDKLTSNLRVDSHVLAEDKKNLHFLILQGVDKTPKCKFVENYRLLETVIDEWCKSIDGGDDGLVVALNEFIPMLLNDIVLIPIHCESQNDALTIFETINNRGLSLSDADIFKAKLYQHTTQTRQATFIEEWNALKNHDWLFRVLMHIIRAESGSCEKEISLRSFFTTKETPLSKPDEIMNSLNLINRIEEENWFDSDEIASLWYIMNAYPNHYWKFPLYVFLHKHGSIDPKTNEFALPGKMGTQFRELLEATVKYFFIKGLLHNRVTAMKQTVYCVCAKIESSGDYISEYRKDLKDANIDLINFEGKQQQRYIGGLVLLSAYLNPTQNKADFREVIRGKYHIEHILPKKWNHYDGWDEDTYGVHLDTLGNCIPLSSSLNIAAKNEFFDRKKVEYKKSTIQDALDLLHIAEWTPKEVEKKHAEKVTRLKDFFNSVWA